VALEVRGCRGDDGAKVRTDPDGDHISGNGLTKSYSCIEALGNDVRKPIVDIHFYLNVRMGENKRRKFLLQNGLRGIGKGRDPN
jgi:hypothetical protein